MEMKNVKEDKHERQVASPSLPTVASVRGEGIIAGVGMA